MDLNDPRRRLQVLNNSNPSIRMATAPAPQKQTISIAQPKALPQISVPKSVAPVQQQAPQAAPNTYKALSKTGEKNKTIFGWNAAAILPKGYEKVAKYGAGEDFQANPDEFLKQFDRLDETGGIKGAYVEDLKKKSATDAVAAQTLKLLADNGRFKGDWEDFIAGSNDKLYGGMSRGFLRGVDFVLPGKNTFGLEAEADRQEGPAQFTSAGKAGETFGSVQKGVVDLASMAIGGGAVEKGASKIPALTQFLEKLQTGGKVSKATAKVLGILPGSLGGSAVDVLQTAGRGDEQNVAKSVGIGTALDIGLPFLGRGIKKGYNIFKGADTTSFSIVDDLIGETDPGAIKKALGIDDDLASYLAQESNPQTVKQILQEMSIDPSFNLPPDVKRRLEEEGITAVQKAESQYGAEYQDGVIRATDQKSLDDNVYHELGHHIYKNKLTPEEQALFKGTGEASQKAAGREGYTPTDVNSEDFSDYMQKALTGRIKEVPEELRPVIAKYAKTAANEAEDLGIAGTKAVDAKTNTVAKTPTDPLSNLKQEALKYKSAEEFVGAKADKYHGTYENFDTFKPYNHVPSEARDVSGQHTFGTYFSDNKDMASQFGNNLKQAHVPLNKPLDLTNVKSIEELAHQLGVKDTHRINYIKNNSYLDNLEGGNFYRALETLNSEFGVAKKLKRQGYDGMIFPDSENGITGNTTLVFDPSQVKTSQQLTDLYNQAHAGAKSAVPTPEQAVGDVSKAQTGVSDGSIAGDGKTTPPEAVQGDLTGQLDNNTELGGNAVKTAENGSQSIVPQKATDIVPEGTDPDTTKAVQDFLDSVNREGGTLDRAQAGYDTAKAARKIETGQRIGKGQALYEEAGGGEQGFRAKLGSLRGKKTASGYTPISVDPEVETSLLDAVEKSKLRPYEKLNTQNALRKVWGANPEKPTSSDLNNIRTFLNKNYGEGTGDEFADGIAQAIKDGRDWKDVASEVAGLPRALMATGDLSGGFRQAMPMGTRFPKLWAKANAESVKWALNPKAYDTAMREIADSPNYQTVQDLMGVDLTGVGAMQDEAFIGAGIAEKIPVAGIGVKAADRAYTGVLTKLRWDVANKIIDDAGGVDKFMKNVEDMHGDKTKEYMRAWGEVINTFTGRGGKKGGALDQHMKTLSTGLFAPRLWAANVQRLNPIWYARLAKTNPQAAKLAVQSQGTFLAMAGTVLSLAAAAGAQVGMDPRSADFGKIKVGNTRYDILGGQQQNIVQIARQVTGEKVNSETGEVAELGDGFGAKTRFDLFTDMLNNKANPLLGFGIKLMNTKDGESGNPFLREDQYGNEFNVGTQAARLAIPLGLQGGYDTSKDVGNPVKGTLMNAPSFFGVGVQTYGNTATKDQAKDKDGKLTFGGKITDDMPLDNDGRPFLDEKGKVVKVKFDKDATDMEKKAALIQAKKNAYKDQARRSMSAEDRGIYKLGEADVDSLDEAQTKKYNQLKKYVDSYGQKADVPEGAKSPAARKFYEKYNTMSKDDQEAWLKESPDENSKTVTSLLNKERSKGLSEFKPSNAVAKAYAEYEADLNDNPDYTEVDKRNKAKAFQTFVYKLNYTDDQRDIFTEGGSADLKTLIDEKQIDKADLDEAIKMDNELYNSGLTGSLKFSKTFRKTYGYGLPDGGGVNKNPGGSGGGDGDGTKRAYLSNLLPSESAGGGSTPAPKFSSKRRTTGISFKNVSTPKSGGKKVKINL